MTKIHPLLSSWVTFSSGKEMSAFIEQNIGAFIIRFKRQAAEFYGATDSYALPCFRHNKAVVTERLCGF